MFAAIVLSILCIQGNAQSTTVVDSLNEVLSKSTIDSMKAKVLVALSYQYISSDSAKSVNNAQLAIELSKSSNYPKGLVDSWYCIGTVNWIRGYLEEGEEYLIKSKTLADSLNLQEETAAATSGLGIISVIRGDHDQALSYLDEAGEIFTAIGSKDGLSIVSIEKGNIHMRMGENAKARENMEEALSIGQELNDNHTILVAYGNLGTIYQNLGDYPKSLEYFLKNVKLALELNDKISVAQTYDAIGELYMIQDDLTNAKEYYLKALKVSQENDDIEREASIQTSLGTLFWKEGDTEKALQYLLEAATSAKNFGHKYYEALSYDRIAEVYITLQEYSKAKNYLDRAMKLFLEIGSNDDVAGSLNALGKIFNEQGAHSTARDYLKRSIAISKDVGYSFTLKDGYEQLAYAEHALGNLGEAYEAHVQFKVISDSLKNDDITKKLTRQQAEFQFQLEKDSIAFAQEKIELRYEQEIERRKVVNQAAIVGGVLVLIILILLYRSYLIKQRKNMELRHKNEVIESRNVELTSKNEEIMDLRETEKRMARETLDLKERELTNVTMLSYEKNELLQQIGDQIGKIGNKVDDRILPDLKEIKRTIKSNISDETWHSFTYHFEQVHPEFFNKLKVQFGDLSQNDLRLCAYIKVGLNNKVIAQMGNITLAAVKKNINRVKKKLNIGPDDSLRDFILEFV